MSKLETARKLGKAHFQVEPNLKFVFILKPISDKDPREPIRLLEVVEGTLERGFEAVAFAPDPARGIDYPVHVIEVSPLEYKSIPKSRRIRLGGRNWEIGEEVKRA